MAISSLAVANFFVEQSINSGIELTPMKVIKLVYIAHGWSLAIRQEPLIDEAVQAWKFGPVVPTVYNSFKGYKDSQITGMAQVYDGLNIISPQVNETNIRLFLEGVWNAYNKFSGWQLSSITHENETPWYITWIKNGGADQSGAIIPNDIIAKHYNALYELRTGNSLVSQ